MSPEDIDNIAQILRSMPKANLVAPAFLECVEHIPLGKIIDHTPIPEDDQLVFICYAPDGLEPRLRIGQTPETALTPVWCIMPWRAWGDSHEPTAGILREQGLDVVAGIMCHPHVFEHLKNMRDAQRIEHSIDDKKLDTERKRKI